MQGARHSPCGAFPPRCLLVADLQEKTLAQAEASWKAYMKRLQTLATESGTPASPDGKPPPPVTEEYAPEAVAAGLVERHARLGREAVLRALVRRAGDF